MFDLQEKLQEEFSDVEIVTLKDLTKKIAVISKVRVGKERSVTDYHEVTLTDVNAYGIIEVDLSKGTPAPANSSAITSQRLHKNDLLVSYRGKDIKVARIDREYKVPVVSNNSAMRIQFDCEDKEETEEVSLFVQIYLQLPYVKEYIDSREQTPNTNRKLLSPTFLADLPIPLFESRDYDFKDFINTRLEMLITAKKMMQEVHNLVNKLENYKDEGLTLYLSTKDYSADVTRRDLERLEELNYTISLLTKYEVL